MDNIQFYGDLVRDIPLNGGEMKKYLHHNDNIYFEASIIRQDHTLMMYVRVTNTRYDEPEYFGRHFNIEWLPDETQQNWLAWIIGDTIAVAIYQSNKNTLAEIQDRYNSLFSAMGINPNIGVSR